MSYGTFSLKSFLKTLIILITVCGGTLNKSFAQTSMIRGDVAFTKSRFIGVDRKEMKNNTSWAVGVLYEGGSIEYDDRYRWHTGGRIRHLQASRDMYSLDTLGQLVTGIESYTYNYLEIPIGAEFDLMGGTDKDLKMGMGLDLFGAIPFGVKGVRDYQDANPWSKQYETPYFILGFALSGYLGVNVDPFGFKVHYMGQFPFIPVAKPAPSSYTGPAYKLQLLGTRGLMVSLYYTLY